MTTAAPFTRSARPTGTTAIELLARDFQERDTRPPEERAGDRRHPRRRRERPRRRAWPAARCPSRPDQCPRRQLTEADGAAQGGLAKPAQHCVRLLLDRGADVRIRDYGDNAYALHFAAEAADFDIVKMLVEAGSDVVGDGRRPPARRARLGHLLSARARGRGGVSPRNGAPAQSLVRDRARSRRRRARLHRARSVPA